MTKANTIYLERLKKRFRYTDNLGKSDLEVVRRYTRHYIYSLPIIMGLFVTNLFRSMDQSFKDDPHGTFDLVVLVMMTIAMGVTFVILVCKYRRAESCRSELEDELINKQKQTEQDASSDR